MDRMICVATVTLGSGPRCFACSVGSLVALFPTSEPGITARVPRCRAR